MPTGVSFRLLFLVLHVALLPVVTQGKEVVLGKEGGTVELPCTVSQRKNMPFSWKFPNDTKILAQQNTYLTRGKTHLDNRIESKSSQWDKGSFPLIIRKLEVKDSGPYICEVDNKKMPVELQVFRLIASSGTRLLQGQTLILAVEGPQGSNPSVQCTKPEGQIMEGKKAISVPNLGFQDSGTWKCTVSQDKKLLQLDIHILVLTLCVDSPGPPTFAAAPATLAIQSACPAFLSSPPFPPPGFQKRKMPSTVYKKEGESVELSFPLTFDNEEMFFTGELSWQADRDSSSQSWITFSVENKKVSVQKATQDPKLQMAEKIPLCLTLSSALLQHAGSGKLTLTLAQDQKLHQEVNLVVMRAAQNQNSLVCEVLGPTSPTLVLSWKLKDQKPHVSKQEKQVQVLSPEAGTWQCLLSDGDQVLLESKVDVVSTGLHQDQSMFLAVVLGGTLGFLLLTGLCIFCCVRCRHQRRQTARMSQIKRLLSEKKTCQCPQTFWKAEVLGRQGPGGAWRGRGGAGCELSPRPCRGRERGSRGGGAEQRGAGPSARWSPPGGRSAAFLLLSLRLPSFFLSPPAAPGGGTLKEELHSGLEAEDHLC
ncbi:T-cell surface glycoprotein CD4 [Erethizon dorsatum]